MIVKITVLLWFILMVWRFFLKAHINAMSLVEKIKLDNSEVKPFWLRGWVATLMIALLMSFVSLVWLLFLR